MARRSGGDLFSMGGYELQLENQEGQRLQFSDEDRRSVVQYRIKTGVFCNKRLF
jgi:hypothetical protein